MSGRALVTGGAGFIGSHLVERLVAEGVRVRVLDDLSTGREDNLAAVRDRVELVRGDLRDPDAVAGAVEGVAWVFHQGAVASVPASIEDPLDTDAVNVRGTLHVLEAARRAGVRRVVFASSAAIYGDGPELPCRETHAPAPRSPYALQKYAAEQYCRLYHALHGLETVCLRYFNVYGPRQDPQSPYAGVISLFAEACLKGESPRVFGDGGQTRDFVYVADAVEANWRAARAAGAGGAVLNVGRAQEVSLLNLLAAIQDAAGTTLPVVHEDARPGDVRRSRADAGGAREALGWSAGVDLAAGIGRTVDFLRGGKAEEDA